MAKESMELGHALETIAKMEDAFEPLERGGYVASDMLEAMQQMREAITALAAWATRQERGH
ncbi:MAG: hypothetical protein E5X86_19830 [Mesorhizobium sp.]|uniref:hypothetical protein n=1 Tax=Mesorhizobium sp. TaxID=1871066 RepID=UPI00121E3026|nr:hypothetical protein [Mesorhizobium sp.]TIO15621.1 MAG: hypothetical protein E5X86_19830 [Mesorhizobium sp.]